MSLICLFSNQFARKHFTVVTVLCSTGLISKFAVAVNKNALLNLHTHTIVIIIHFISIIALALVAAWQVCTDGVGGARFVFRAFIYICV